MGLLRRASISLGEAALPSCLLVVLNSLTANTGQSRLRALHRNDCIQEKFARQHLLLLIARSVSSTFHRMLLNGEILQGLKLCTAGRGA